MRFFKRIYIEITNVCNLNCAFCPKTTREAQFMEIGLFEEILKGIKKYTQNIYFHVMGEPLLHPRIEHFLDLAHKYNYRVNITTNGLLINEVKETLLSKPAIRLINFSLHSFDTTRVDCNIDEYLSRILNFISMSNERESNSKTICCLRLWNLDKKKDSSSDKNRYILEKIKDFFKIKYRIEEAMTEGNGVKLSEGVYLSQSSFFDWPDSRIPELGGRGFCLGLRDQIAFLVDGTVVPCCLDSEGTIDLGNIKLLPFTDIIKSKRAVDIYNGFSERRVVEPLCRKCAYRKRFDKLSSPDIG